MPERLFAPWTPEQVDALNQYQEDAPMHPFTCPYRDNTRAHFENEEGVLAATEQGWVCRSRHCAYTQDWAHPFMADLSWWQD